MSIATLDHLSCYNRLFSGCKRVGTLFYGSSLVHNVVHYLVASALLEGKRVVMVTGANRANPYLVSRILSGASNNPRALLQRFVISRAFTCYQFHKAVCDTANSFHENEILILLGPCTIIASEETPKGEWYPTTLKVVEKTRRLIDLFENVIVSASVKKSEPDYSHCCREFWKSCSRRIKVHEIDDSFYFSIKPGFMFSMKF